MQQKLAKASLSFSFMTMLSRIFGFLRDMVAAHIFGASIGYDAFIVAFRIPNLMRRLFAEGSFSQAFVPVISEYRVKKTPQQVQKFLNYIAGNLGLVLLLITAIGSLSASGLVLIFAPGFAAGGTSFVYATDMLRITFPYVFFISLTAFAGAILNSYGRFAIPAFTPIFLNLSLLIAMLWIAPGMQRPEIALAWGVIAAGAIQLFFQLPFLLKLNLLPKPKINWQDPGVKKVLILMLPAMLGASVSQINILVDTVFASFLPQGSITWLYVSDRLMEFPLGIFGVGLATVLLPSLSRQYVSGSEYDYSATLDWGVRCIFIIGIPAMLGLYLLSGPLLSTLFQSGKFSSHDVVMSQQSLMAYSLAVLGIMLTKVFASAFFARQDLKTPVKIAIISLLANIGLNFLLIGPLAHAGLALATSIASVLNAGLLFFCLIKLGIYNLQPGWSVFLLRILTANMALVCCVVYLTPNMQNWLSWGRQYKGIYLLSIIFSGVIIYSLSLFFTGLKFKEFLAIKAGGDSTNGRY